ncbi:MAG: hypothetical protein GY859_09230, partial [Desulfobacterales bacterium]|nr:hypothetical protein [Desulfobacterales bacterium]
MEKTTSRIESDFDPRFKLFHELMANKIRDVLLVSTPYDAWIMEEDCRLSERIKHPGVDRTFLWTGNTDLLVALIKNAEDFMNAPHDTSYAGIRVIIFVDDSPVYMSSLPPNDHPDAAQRLAHLAAAIKMVYASTWFHGPRSFSRRVGNRTEEEKMAVIIQEMVG